MPTPGETRTADPGQTRTRLLAILTTIAVVAALKLTHAVTLPLFLAIFLIVIAWPIQMWLERRLPRWLAFIATVLVIFLASAVIAGAFISSANRIADRAPQLAERFDQLLAQGVAWAKANHFPVPSGGSNREQIAQRLSPMLATAASLLYSTLGILALVIAFVLLGLLEVRDFEAKIDQRLRQRLGDAVLDTAERIASKVRRYLVALTISSAVSGVLTGLFSLVMGLELAFLWGLTAFLLNYVPTLGPLVAVIPPTLFALLQFEGLGRPVAVFAGIGAIQFFIGNFVDPKIEGKVLSLSPLVVLFSIVFWGWVWGVFGALIAVPLTVAIVIVSQQFEGTKWVASMLTGRRGERDAAGEAQTASLAQEKDAR